MARAEEADVQDLNDIASYHEDAVKALTRYFSDWENIDGIQYIGKSRAEISQIFQERLSETELRSVLQLLASLEAALRVDFILRCEAKKKDNLSKAFRSLYRDKKYSVRLDEDILELWIDHHPQLKDVVGKLRGAFHLRHWLAHGRYWRPKNWIRYSYLDIEAIATVFFDNFPLQGS